MSATPSDSQLIDKIEHALDSWNHVTLEIKRNALARKYDTFQYCFKLEAVQDDHSRWISGGDRTLRELLDHVGKELDERIKQAVIEKLQA